ncbi:MAG: anti-sigma factor antagonist [Lachnospiraceae bacterium]|nr:anti-sigma factor antagonist [Lachnospiraceae bacterium]
MIINKKDSKLEIKLEGRIDTNNAPDVEQEIMSALDANDCKEPVFDAENLDYISSAGLRVLMKVRKKINKPVDVINVSKDVYDIFETTGFTDLLNVKKAYRKISIDGLQLLGQGMTGNVYRMDDETVLKVFHPNISFDLLISKENKKARNAFVYGVPTAIPYDIVKVGDCYGIVYEMIKSKDLATVMSEDKSKIEEYMTMFAKTVRQMHSIHVEAGKLDDLKTTSIQALGYFKSVMTDEEIQKVQRVYENIPDSDIFIHGDCHMGNAMLQDGELMFIDLSSGGMGHPIFDMVSMYSIYERADNDKARAASPMLRLFSSDEIKKMWNVFIHTYFEGKDDEFIKEAEKQIALFSVTRRLFMYVALPGSLTPEQFNAMKDRVISSVDAGIDPICF